MKFSIDIIKRFKKKEVEPKMYAVLLRSQRVGKIELLHLYLGVAFSLEDVFSQAINYCKTSFPDDDMKPILWTGDKVEVFVSSCIDENTPKKIYTEEDFKNKMCDWIKNPNFGIVVGIEHILKNFDKFKSQLLKEIICYQHHELYPKLKSVFTKEENKLIREKIKEYKKKEENLSTISTIDKS